MCLISGKVREISEIIEKNPFKLLTVGTAETIFPAFPEDAGGRCSGETMRASQKNEIDISPQRVVKFRREPR